MTMIRWRRETALDVYILALAVILIMTPWLFSYTLGISRADDWMAGVLVAACAAAAVLAFAEWQEWATLALGVWIAASPWVLGFQHAKAMPINVGLGILIVYLSALELWLIHYNPAPRDRRGGPAVT
jgi:hypothetical protein